MVSVNSLAQAEALDAADLLAPWRERFSIPPGPDGQPCLYLCGNSLGLQPKTAHDRMAELMRAWAEQGIAGYFGEGGWGPYADRVKAPLARLVGAHPDEVAAANTLTVNLHLMLSAFYQPTAQRWKILVEEKAFPSDRYAAASQLRARGYDERAGLVELSPRHGESTLRTDDIIATLERADDVALLLLSGINYYTGQLFELEPIVAAAQRRGIVVGVDLAHAIGNVPLELHRWGVDFAAWCSYKYLNAGPGAVGGLYVHRRHHGVSSGRLEGWWGYAPEGRFLMRPWFEGAVGADAWVMSSPPAPMLALLAAGLEAFEAVGLPTLRAKSLGLTGLLEQRLATLPAGQVEVITPSDPAQRGAQLSLRVGAHRKALYQALTARGVVGDWREPDVIRVAPVPLYNRYAEVWRLVELIRELL